MSRLTKWNGKKWVLPQGRTSDGKSNWRIIAEKLAEYENIGEPESLTTVIRCRDCKYRSGNYCHHTMSYGSFIRDDGFCSNARKAKEGETNEPNPENES